MRIRTGHGPDDWTVSIPASPGSMPIRGQLVVGGPGAYDKARQAEYQRKHAEKVRAEKADAA